MSIAIVLQHFTDTYMYMYVTTQTLRKTNTTLIKRLFSRMK